MIVILPRCSYLQSLLGGSVSNRETQPSLLILARLSSPLLHPPLAYTLGSPCSHSHPYQRKVQKIAILRWQTGWGHSNSFKEKFFLSRFVQKVIGDSAENSHENSLHRYIYSASSPIYDLPIAAVVRTASCRNGTECEYVSRMCIRKYLYLDHRLSIPGLELMVYPNDKIRR